MKKNGTLTVKEEKAIALDNFKADCSDFIVERAGALTSECMNDIFDVECLAEDLNRLVRIDQRIDNAKTIAEAQKILKRNFIREELKFGRFSL